MMIGVSTTIAVQSLYQRFLDMIPDVPVHILEILTRSILRDPQFDSEQRDNEYGLFPRKIQIIITET